MYHFFKITAVLILLVAFSTAAYSTTLHVPTTYPTIQAAINAAAVGDTVLLEPGIYHGDGNRDIDFIGKDITVRSRDLNPATCTIACQGNNYVTHRGFIFQSGESSQARLEGITISGGVLSYYFNEEDGGGILCSNGSSPIIRNCRVTNCSAIMYGGGLAVLDSSPTIIDCKFDNNYSEYGGGIAARGDGPLTMTGSIVMNNFSGYQGAGIYLECYSSYLSECIIANNEGTGLFSAGSSTITFSTIYGNWAGVESDGNLIMENSIIAFNRYSYSEDGFWFDLNCCNVFGNEMPDWGEVITNQQGINGNISSDPLLCDPENWDYHVAPESPCLNYVCGQIGAFGAGDCGDLPSPAGEALAVSFELRGNYPNPFNPSTTISYELDQDMPVMLQIFDVTGKLVRTLKNGNTQTAGAHEAFWNGRDNSGHGVAAGVFLYVLTTSAGRDTGRMALIK